MFKLLVSIFLVFFYSNLSFSQFYYSDILMNKIANDNYSILKSNKIKKVTSKSTSNEGELNITQTFSKDWKTLETETNLSIGQANISTTYYLNNLVSKKVVSEKNIFTIVEFDYINDNKLKSILTRSEDTSVQKGFSENHIFNYDQNGVLSNLFKIKNSSDTTFIEFVKDSSNNIIGENWYYNKKLFETYYYYYNTQNQLTDIVKFNLKANRMLPEFLFEYDVENKLIQMTQIPFGSSNYFIWKYSYNNNKLKSKEVGYNKNGELLGQMEYEYFF